MDAEAVARVLAGIPVFSALSDAERTELVTHLRPRRFSRDEVVVAVERDGAVFGELALFDDAPRSATVTALDETQVVTLARVRTNRGPGVPRRARAGGEVPARPRDGTRAHRYRAYPGRPRGLRRATRVSVNRVLADLEAQGAIAVGRRHIAVKEPALLRKHVRY